MQTVLYYQISIHTTLAGGDNLFKFTEIYNGISIHTTLAGGDIRFRRPFVIIKISIHTTLAGGDPVKGKQGAGNYSISIHTTLAGGDQSIVTLIQLRTIFQSTPPSRVATSAFKSLILSS